MGWMASSHKSHSVALLIIILISVKVHTYEVPNVNIVALKPQGLRISIPDEPGVQFFTFHGEINRMISYGEDGTIHGDVTRPTSGQWVFEDSRISLGAADVLNYWLLVQHNGIQHAISGRTWTPSSMPNRVSEGTSCSRGVTTIQNGVSTCRDQLIFEEKFDSMNSSLWTREIKIPFHPDYEFCVYKSLSTNAVVGDGRLRLIPSLLEDSYENQTNIRKLELAQCTSNKTEECSRNVTGYNILPPVISAQLTTASSFSFKYGTIEIRAKFPEGDWLYPEMWLQPRLSAYGEGYASGRVRLGMARGNRRLVKNTGESQTDYGAGHLEFGLRVNGSNVENEIVSKVQSSPWTTDFHVYSTTWTMEGFTFKVDGEQVGRLTPGSNGWSRGDSSVPSVQITNMAPFDKEFYITLGLGVGGMRDFPDATTSGDYEKPWKNVGAKAMLHFSKARDKWLPSWRRDNALKAAFEVDYVKVWAV